MRWLPGWTRGSEGSSIDIADATAPGIAAMSENVFQANPDYLCARPCDGAVCCSCARRPEIRGPFCKRYDEQAHGGSIHREVRAIGGEMVSTGVYTPGQTDLRDELARTRQRGMERAERS